MVELPCIWSLERDVLCAGVNILYEKTALFVNEKRHEMKYYE